MHKLNSTRLKEIIREVMDEMAPQQLLAEPRGASYEEPPSDESEEEEETINEGENSALQKIVDYISNLSDIQKNKIFKALNVEKVEDTQRRIFNGIATYERSKKGGK